MEDVGNKDLMRSLMTQLQQFTSDSSRGWRPHSRTEPRKGAQRFQGAIAVAAGFLLDTERCIEKPLARKGDGMMTHYLPAHSPPSLTQKYWLRALLLGGGTTGRGPGMEQAARRGTREGCVSD